MNNAFPPVTRIARKLATITVLAAVLAAVHFGVYQLRFDGHIEPVHLDNLLHTIGFFLVLKAVAFVWFRLHLGWTRLVSFHDLVAIGEATTVGSLLIVLVDYLLLTDRSIARSIVVLDWGATLVVICGLRGLSRLVHERYRRLFRRPNSTRRALIVGTDRAAEAIIRAVKANGNSPHDIVGLIDHNKRYDGGLINGVPILGTLDRIHEIARRHDVEEILITSGDVPGVRLREIVADCRANKLRVSMLPSYEQLLSGQVAVKTRDVAIDDLLRRNQVKLDTDQIHQWLEGRVLMVTGSAGSIGSEVCRQLLQFKPSRIVLVDRSENGQFIVERQLRALAPQMSIDVRIADIADTGRIRQLFDELQPEVLFHAAAFKHVPLMEQNPSEGVKNNILATRNLADIAHEFGLQAFVLISTDKAVNPTSVMGACKRAAELYVQSRAESSDCRYVTVRFGNVLDSAGSVVPIFREQIANGGPVTITDLRMERFFMTIPEAAQLVIQAGAMGQGGEVFVLDMGVPVRIVDLAQDMIRLSGLQVGRDIELKVTGLRPGEKLFEELHVDGETHQPTRHPKIQVVMRTTKLTPAEISEGLDRLASVVNEPAYRIITELQRLVAEYRPDFSASSGLRLLLPPKVETDNDCGTKRVA